MSRFDIFKDELEKLCIRHRVQLFINIYEHITVSNLNNKEHPLRIELDDNLDENDCSYK